MLATAFALYIFVLTLVRPSMAPPLPPEARTLKGSVWSLLVVLAIATVAFFLGESWAAARNGRRPR